MKTILTLLTVFLLSSGSLNAQIDKILGKILEKTQEKSQNNDTEVNNPEMDNIKNLIKNFTTGINDLDKYSAELKCAYVLLKLGGTYESLDSELGNAALCKEQYDLYGMQLMVLASFTSVGYCFDNLMEIIPEADDKILTPEYKKFLDEYINTVSQTMVAGTISANSELEKDFIKTLTQGLMTFDFVYAGDKDSNTYKLLIYNHIDKLLRYLILEYYPVEVLAKSIKIGTQMKALHCSNGRT